MAIPTRGESEDPLDWTIGDQWIIEHNDLMERMASAEGDIGTVSSGLVAANGDISALQGMLANAGGRTPIARGGGNAVFDLGAITAGGTYTSGGVNVGSTYYMPFSVPRALSLSHLYCNVTTGASRSAYLAIYSNKTVSGEDLPDSRLAVLTASLSATGYAGGALGTPLALDPGRLYWRAISVINTGSGSVQVSYTPASVLALALGFSASAFGNPYLRRVASETAPATAGSTTLETTVPPAIFARFS